MVSWSAHFIKLRHDEEIGLNAIIQSAARENTGRETLEIHKIARLQKIRTGEY